MREQRWGLIPLAIEAVRHTLEVKKDARLAIKILRDLGIPQHKSDEPELPQHVAQQESEDPEVKAIADVLMRCVKLSTEQQDAMAKKTSSNR
jgi:hypothetical protein